jgi:hypothetical protein
MAMRSIICKTIILSWLVLIFSCNQDPIFFTISTETAPVPPRIPGNPTNMVVFKRNSVPIMYVASGSLHWYTASNWDLPEYNIPQPGGRIIDLAASNDYLYALSISSSGESTTLRRIGPAANGWEDISISTNETNYTIIQTIFADKTTGRLFAGVMNNNNIDYGIFYLDGTTLKLLQGDTEMLSGAAYRNNFHYLSTRGRGVYMVSETALSTNDPSSTQQLNDVDAMINNRLFMGMIQLVNEQIIAVERDGGALFKVQETGFKQIKYSNEDNVATGRYATGALALWQQVIFDENGDPGPGTSKILVAGIQGVLYSNSSISSSSYTHGYVEFELKENGSINIESSRRDNSPSITVDGNTDRYTATIGKHPLNHMYQTTPDIDANMTFFASTQTAGLWSYRNRDGGWQWNAEN